MIIEKPTMDVKKSIYTLDAWGKRKFGIPASNSDAVGAGFYLVAGPTLPPESEVASNQYCDLNFTGPPGSGSNILYRFLFQIPKWSYGISKIDEWIDVSPTHREYYERTMTAKDTLANTIKSGLGSITSAVSDYELVNHDLRRYREIMGYFNEKTEHALKSMFIDQVDVHNGAMSMVQMVQRWPTLIYDFQRLTDKDNDIDNIAKKLKVPKAEAVVLKTKNILFIEWKRLFVQAAKDRFERLMGLAEARKKSIDEYRSWLKPYIVRFRRLKAGYKYEKSRNLMLRSFVDIAGQSTYINGMRFWLWRYFKPYETRRAPAEQTGEFVLEPYDDFMKYEFVLDTKSGLASIYPWLLHKDPKNPKQLIADRIAREQKKEILGGLAAPAIRPYYIYFTFIDMEIIRLGIKLPSGEQEDITFRLNNFTCSLNVMFLKLMEMRCREIQLDRYIDSLLGIKTKDGDIVEIAKKEYPKVYGLEEPKEPTGFAKIKGEVSSFTNAWTKWHNKTEGGKKPYRIPGRFMFFKPGPYEFDFRQRVNKGYLIPVGRYYHGTIMNYLKKQMKIPGWA